MFYLTIKDKVAFWGKLSECAAYLESTLNPGDYAIKYGSDSLTPEQREWLHKIKKNLHSSASIQ